MKQKITLIAEIGNCHEGSLDAAIEMLEKAKESGADLAKFQAGHAEGFARRKEDVDRYRKYELGLDGYKKLIQRGEEINLPVFFSIWSDDFLILLDSCKYHKLASRQYNMETINKYATSPDTFVSIPHTMPFDSIMSIGVGNGIPFHCVSEYPAINPSLERITWLEHYFKRDVGYSDHSIGIENSCKAVKEYGATYIEKHFTLSHDFGHLRDHQHAATVSEFTEMVSKLKK